MSTLLDVRPPDPEPLPLYSRQDPDSLSVLSAAPSYVSETPSYRSYRTPTSLLPPLAPGQQTIGLPAPRVYAPGFAPELRNRASGRTPEFSFNIENWKQLKTKTHQRLNPSHVIDRPTTSTTSTISSPTSSIPSVSAYPVQVEPIRPLEDPYLVGEEAAERARRSRVHREMCARDAETLRHESRSWDFMVGQMSDWDERSRSWNSFKANLPKRSKGLGKRLGWRS